MDIVMDDHFHLECRNVEIRGLLKHARETIVKRINAKDKEQRYDPRLIESREVLKQLVADGLLRRRYQKLIRTIVD